MQEKISEIFERIKFLKSVLTLSQANIIEKIRYDEEKRKLIVIKNPIQISHGCWVLITNVLLNDILKQLKRKLEITFLELSIKFV